MSAPWQVGGLNDNCVMVAGSDGLPVMIVQCPVRHRAIAAQIVLEHNAHAALKEALLLAAEFIENVSDEDPDRTAKFFLCREAWRNALAKAAP